MSETGDGWSYVDAGPYRIRYRHDGADHAHFSAGYTIETCRPDASSEWRAVTSWQARDWFAIGLLAADVTPLDSGS